MGVVPTYARAVSPGDLGRHLKKVRNQKHGKRQGMSAKSLRKRGVIASAPLARYVPRAEHPASEVPLVLCVPVPDRGRPDVEQPNGRAARDGQDEFRRKIIEAYGGCAVSGCAVVATLEAAHIIPYVSAASNLMVNGLCLRADLHKLFDRGLLRVDSVGTIAVDTTLSGTDYAQYHGRQITFPSRSEDRPDPQLLSVRHLFI